MPVGDTGQLETLQAAAVATGNGTAIDMEGANRLTVQVRGTFVGTVTFEGSIDGTNYFAVGLKTAADAAAVTTATAAGQFKLPTDGPALAWFRGRVSAYTSGSITVESWKEHQ